MKTSSDRWIEHLKDIHPLLALPGRPAVESGAGDKAEGGASLSARRWAANKIEMDTASATDAAVAREERERAARRREEGYDNPFVTWAGLAAAVVIGILGYLPVEHLIQQSRLEDCLLAHRHSCEHFIDHR
jgi:hypothetical protein